MGLLTAPGLFTGVACLVLTTARVHAAGESACAAAPKHGGISNHEVFSTHSATAAACCNLCGGHTFCVSGVRFLVGSGLPTEAVMLMARWKSAIVEHYIGEAPLLAAAAVFQARVAGRMAERTVVRVSAEADLRGKCCWALEDTKRNAAARGWGSPGCAPEGQ